MSLYLQPRVEKTTEERMFHLFHHFCASFLGIMLGDHRGQSIDIQGVFPRQTEGKP